MGILRRGYFLALAVAGYLSPARLCAQPLPTPARAPAGATSDGQSELEIRALLREQAQRARRYRYAWTGINAGLAVGSFALLPLVDHETRKDYVVSGIASTLSTLTTFAFPLTVESADSDLDALEALPPGERRKKLSALLEAGATDEHDRVTWPWHLLNLGTSALTGGIIAVGFGHVRNGIQTGLIGFVLGEVQIFTQPTALVGAHLAEPNAGALRWQPLLSLQERAFSVGVSAEF